MRIEKILPREPATFNRLDTVCIKKMFVVCEQNASDSPAANRTFSQYLFLLCFVKYKRNHTFTGDRDPLWLNVCLHNKTKHDTEHLVCAKHTESLTCDCRYSVNRGCTCYLPAHVSRVLTPTLHTQTLNPGLCQIISNEIKLTQLPTYEQHESWDQQMLSMF